MAIPWPLCIRTMRHFFWRALAVSLLLALQACATGPAGPSADLARVRPVFTSDFESGGIGAIRALDPQETTWRLSLKNDNDDPGLPASFRTWFYVKVANVSPDRPLTLEFDGFGSRYPVMPVYSYDGVQWTHFRDDEISWQGCRGQALVNCRATIRKAFAGPVSIARTFPYTTADLDAFLNRLAASPLVRRDTLGISPVYQKPITLLTLDDASLSIPGVPKRYVWLHARTHPGETGPSFVLEGLIPRVLADDAVGRSLRSRYIFKIVPMHNPDGVIAGNYRTTPASVNLEDSWRFDASGADVPGDSPAPYENQVVLRGGILPVLQAGGRFDIALNLHASNAAVDMPAFFIPHFGGEDEFGLAEQRLWRKQQHLVALTASYYEGQVTTENEDGGANFLNHFFPESWWWRSQQDRVNAITFETTYGKGGLDRWLTQDDLRRLGDALALAINDIGSASAACVLASVPLPGCEDVEVMPIAPASLPDPVPLAPMELAPLPSGAESL